MDFTLQALGFEIVCRECGTAIVAGFDLRSPKDVLKLYGGRCKKCGTALSPVDFQLEVVKL